MYQLLKVFTMAGLLIALPAATLACDGKACDLSKKPCDISAKKSAAASNYHAHGKHHAIPGKTPDYIRKIVKAADRLGLSDKQRKQVGELLIQAETGAAAVHARAQIAVADFKSKLHAGDATERDIKDYAKQMGELHSAKLQANLKASVAAAKLLSAEQKQMLYAHKKGHK